MHSPLLKNKRIILFRLAEKSILSVCAFLWRLIPLRIKTSLLTSAPPIGRLDWVSAKIFLYTHSALEYKRLRSCRAEPHTVHWISNTLYAGDVLYDIGANVGAYALIAARHTKGFATVYAFEPSSTTFAALLRNVVLNKLEKCVIPLKIALTNENYFGSFGYSSIKTGAAEHYGCEKGDRLNISELMQFWSLDKLVETARLKLPTHLKIDTDGHELQVLGGATRTLTSSSLRHIQVEVRDQKTLQAIVHILKQKGFTPVASYQHNSSPIYDYSFEKTK